MKIHPKREMPSADTDMTPMIDVTFQLIAFFMFVLQFSDAETNERIRLPASELAKPAEAPLAQPITLQLTKEGTVLYAGEELALSRMRPALQRERALLERLKKSISDATIIIRADAETKTGMVQELIRVAQEVGFEKFVMRAMHREEGDK
jgi:biopolymer transport protein ExbD